MMNKLQDKIEFYYFSILLYKLIIIEDKINILINNKNNKYSETNIDVYFIDIIFNIIKYPLNYIKKKIDNIYNTNSKFDSVLDID